MSTFNQLGINKTYVKALLELNIEIPTAIQEQTIPILLNSKTDFIGLAQTGTGKTVAFGLPALHHTDSNRDQIQILILSPTRELVQQIKKQLFKMTKFVENKIFVEAVYGGEKIDKQIKALRRPTHVIVATPGRLLDLMERDAVDISAIKILILDEADEMLSMGFKDELDAILNFTKGERNTWLFSATMPEEIQKIVSTYMSPETEKVTINKDELVNANISHEYIITPLKDKFNVLVSYLELQNQQRGIIFCRTKLGAQKLTRELLEEGFSVGALEGDMLQKERDKVMRAFKKENLQILVSTDVSARGIDVQNLAFIVHHQLPEQMSYYTHRSGRTARAGKKGNAMALILPTELQHINQIQSALGIEFKEVMI